MVSFDAPSHLLFALTIRTRDKLPFYSGPFHWPVSLDRPANPLEGVET
jgi:hypothetical protein